MRPTALSRLWGTTWKSDLPRMSPTSLNSPHLPRPDSTTVLVHPYRNLVYCGSLGETLISSIYIKLSWGHRPVFDRPGARTDCSMVRISFLGSPEVGTQLRWSHASYLDQKRCSKITLVKTLLLNYNCLRNICCHQRILQSNASKLKVMLIFRCPTIKHGRIWLKIRS